MPAIVTLNLRDLLVDPQAHSARRAPVDEAYLGRLLEALDEGADLPPLKVARLLNPALPAWNGGYEGHDARGASERARRMSRDGWVNLLADPDFALYDGHALYVALKLRDRASWPCQVAAQPVGGPRELFALSLRANLANGRYLDDRQAADSLCELWLGHQPGVGGYETFVPERGALSTTEIMALLGKSETWVHEFKRYTMVSHRTRLDLGRQRSQVLARVPAEQWEELCWVDRDTPRLHALRGPKGQVLHAAQKTIDQCTLGELDNLVRWWLSRAELPQVAPAAGPEQTPVEVEPERRAYQAALPDIDWGRFEQLAHDTRQLAAVVRQLPDADLVRVYAEQQVAFAPIKELHDLTEDELRRRRIDAHAFLQAAA